MASERELLQIGEASDSIENSTSSAAEGVHFVDLQLDRPVHLQALLVPRLCYTCTALEAADRLRRAHSSELDVEPEVESCMKRLPPSATVCLCALSFIVGRFIPQIPGLPQVPQGVSDCLSSDKRRPFSDNPLRQTWLFQAQVTIRRNEQPGRRLLPEEQALKQPGADSNKASYTTFEEAVANSQQLQTRPPVEVTDSGLGSEAYLTQPFQHLSWYPR